jgi:IS30 family transposase
MVVNIDVYFVHSYRSWEGGLNENTNELPRQHIPKKTDFRKSRMSKLGKCCTCLITCQGSY